MISSEILKRIDEQPEINPAVGKLVNDNDAVVASLGPALQYAQAVEAEVEASALVAGILLPNPNEELGYFLAVWKYQEKTHGEAELKVLRTVDLKPKPTVDHKTSMALRTAGLLARVSSGFHDIAEVGVLAYMALGEDEVLSAYPKMKQELLRIGEDDLAEELFAPMIAQEALHKSYQVAAVAERVDQLRPWQVQIAGKYIEHFYLPVGVQRSNTERMRGFGQMAVTLSPDNPLEPAHRAENLAARLLDMAPSSSGFLVRRYQECIDEFQQT